MQRWVYGYICKRTYDNKQALYEIKHLSLLLIRLSTLVVSRFQLFNMKIHVAYWLFTSFLCLALSFVFAPWVHAKAIPSLGQNIMEFKLNSAVGKNQIKFISNAPSDVVNGVADGITGGFRLNPADLESTSGKVTVEVRSMKTAITRRDQHMYSDTWLDADRYPVIVLEVKSLRDIRVSDENGRSMITATAVCGFSLHGVTKDIAIPVKITVVLKSAETEKRASGDLAFVSASFKVRLKDFNITGKAGVIGSKVGEVIEINVNLFANS